MSMRREVLRLHVLAVQMLIVHREIQAQLHDLVLFYRAQHLQHEVMQVMSLQAQLSRCDLQSHLHERPEFHRVRQLWQKVRRNLFHPGD
jgi:hypothetical protein